MFRLRVIQARFGDCLLLEFGYPDTPKYILIDGGPSGVYAAHLHPELLKIPAAGRKLALIILSHVDNDHVIGLLDMFADLKADQDNNQPPFISIDGLWHNSFQRTIDPLELRTGRLQSVLGAYKAAGIRVNSTSFGLEGIGEGQNLRTMSLSLGISVNPGFEEKAISLESAPDKIPIDNIFLRVIGPTKKNLSNLRKKWDKWLRDQETRIETANLLSAADLDDSIPNLSSIIVLAEGEGKKILLTGDALGRDIIKGLGQAGLLDAEGKVCIDLLKLPHHGSWRNVNDDFFRKVIADQYLISADGTDDNPDIQTLKSLVKVAHQQGRTAHLVLTNHTPSLDELKKDMNPDEFDYTLKTLQPNQHSLLIE
jgi:beta-lactamase superfamily II metal-dependent hydrolase